jgi:two-component system, OmpR family, phosphate regulon sensor histidine kinase PhoR
LLAIAGHDLRQPLQVITSAHDVLAQTLDSEEQREELTRAEDATAQLASSWASSSRALQLRERSGDDLHLPVPLRPILEDLAAAEPDTQRDRLHASWRWRVVTSRRCGAELRIEVRDTGVGIRASALSAIFRAFQRGASFAARIPRSDTLVAQPGKQDRMRTKNR